MADRFALVDGVEFVSIPVDGATVIFRPATDEDRARYADAYEDFKNPAPGPAPADGAPAGDSVTTDEAGGGGPGFPSLPVDPGMVGD